MRHPDEYDHRATPTVTPPVTVVPLAPVATTTPLHKRRMLFVSLLALVLLPSLVAAVLPNAQADDTVVAAAEVIETPPSSQPSTTTAVPTTAAAPTTVAAPTTTAAPKPSTTSTTAKPKATTTTTTAPRAAQAPAAAVAPAAPAPAPPVASGGGPTAAEAAFLACIRQRESGGNYSVVSSNGLWFGAYQMTRQTWNSTAQRAGRPDLVGVPPNQASPGDQDHLALVLYRWLGKSPWGGAC